MLVRKKTPRIYTPAKDVRDLTHIFKSHGAKVAFRYYRGKQLLSMSYREFSDLIVELAAGFDAMGLSGKRIAVIGESCPQWIATYLATIAWIRRLQFPNWRALCPLQRRTQSFTPLA